MKPDAKAEPGAKANSDTKAARVLCVVGARPNFMKMAPVLRALGEHPGLEPRLVHTGQHYDPALSDAFFADLGMPQPDRHLEVGSGSHGAQTARILERFEAVLQEERPDLVLVAGDVNSTVACALAAVKLWIPVGHIEAGLRSGDRTMPEEINRILTDSISDLLFITSEDAETHLLREGARPEDIHFVGNSMIDSLRRHEAGARDREAWGQYDVEMAEYLLVTLHRPSNVDAEDRLRDVVRLLREAAEHLPVLLPLHPRTRNRLKETGLQADLESIPGIRILPALGYLDFLSLTAGARLVLTDSGGVQEETTALGVPCLTLRPNTERPVTVTSGTNLLVSDHAEDHIEILRRFVAGRVEVPNRVPALWDGHAGSRIVETIGAWWANGAPSRVRPR